MAIGTIWRECFSRPPDNVWRHPVQDNTHHGFSLIEVLIVVLIIGILSQTALPQYDQFMTKQRRADGKALLRENSALLRECLTISGTGYDQCELRILSSEGYYNLTSNRTATTYILSAVPTNKNGQHRDTDCAALTLTHDRRESATGTKPDSCW